MNETVIKTAVLMSFFLAGFNSFSQNYVFTSEEASVKDSTGARSAQTGFAEEEFRKGVQAYYRGSYNDAILEFEKALSFLPSENIILEWLGKAYYRAGLEGTALAQWTLASENGYGGLLLKNKMEIIRERRISDNSYETPVKYTESGSYPGLSFDGKSLVFSQPVSVLPNPDGSMWIVSYGSNELLRMDINAVGADICLGTQLQRNVAENPGAGIPPGVRRFMQHSHQDIVIPLVKKLRDIELKRRIAVSPAACFPAVHEYR